MRTCLQTTTKNKKQTNKPKTHEWRCDKTEFIVLNRAQILGGGRDAPPFPPPHFPFTSHPNLPPHCVLQLYSTLEMEEIDKEAQESAEPTLLWHVD